MSHRGIVSGIFGGLLRGPIATSSSKLPGLVVANLDAPMYRSVDK